jgi:predicted PurR-regulated permease PerM
MPGNDRKLLVLATVLLVAAVLYWAQAILIPLAVATLLAFLLSPLAEVLQRWAGSPSCVRASPCNAPRGRWKTW